MLEKINFSKAFLCRISKNIHHFLGRKYYCCSLDKDSLEITYVFHVNTKIVVDATQAFLKLLKYDTEDLGKFSISDIIVADIQEIESNIHKILNHGMTEISLRQYRCKDGQMLFVGSSFKIAQLRNEQYLIATLQDVTELQQMRNRLQLASQVFEHTSDGILVTDINGIIQFVNPAFVKHTGYSLDEIIGKTPGILKSGRHEDQFYKDIWKALNTDGLWRGEITNKRKNGEIYSEWVVIDAVKNELGKVTMYCGIFRDMSERMKYEEKIRFHAYHDALTGLPNRMFFYEKISQCVALAKRYNHMMAVMYVDLDGFKHVNDNLGHDKGDLLLKAVALRLKECIRESDIVARMGGDEFTLILPEVTKRQDIKFAAIKIKNQLNQTFELMGCSVKISSSIGISIYPNDGEDVDSLIKKADNAMYQAKASGKNAYRFSDNT
jgi:diguanylate cyclase (GGDEF)-like protein/PAS domain S-box-containing protein